MRRTYQQLSARTIAAIRKPGVYRDGAGLYLKVGPSGSKTWVYRFMLRGRARWMGLGSADTFSLAEARRRAADCRKLLADGVDPLDARKAERAKLALDAAKTFTFTECATAYIGAHRAGWRNKKHVGQWESTLTTYAGPVFGHLPVAQVDTILVLRALEPIWTEKHETATRLRGRLEKVLDWAKVRDCTGENPARWKGHLDKLLPKIEKRKRVKHHAALLFIQTGAFMAALREQPGTAARALEFLILTACRTGEVIGARWNEST